MRELLLRIVAMLTKMSRMSNLAGSGHVKEFEDFDTDTVTDTDTGSLVTKLD